MLRMKQWCVSLAVGERTCCACTDRDVNVIDESVGRKSSYGEREMCGATVVPVRQSGHRSPPSQRRRRNSLLHSFITPDVGARRRRRCCCWGERWRGQDDGDKRLGGALRDCNAGILHCQPSRHLWLEPPIARARSSLTGINTSQRASLSSFRYTGDYVIRMAETVLSRSY